MYVTCSQSNPHLQNNHLLGVQDSLAITVAITFTSVTKQVVQLLVEAHFSQL